MDAALWMQMKWMDTRLAWDPEEYNGLQDIRYGSGSKPGSGS